MLIDLRTDFWLYDCNLWLPIPYDDKTMVLIPDIASLRVLWSLTVKLSFTETKYEESVDNPPTPLWLSVL